jgi:hypothetical protein
MFAIIGIWELILRLEADNVDLEIDLSEQHLGACTDTVCEGGPMETPLDRALIGVALEEHCPYRARDTPCGTYTDPDWWKTGKRLGRWEKIPFDADGDALETLNKVPVVGAMPIYTSFFNYVEGVYEHLPGDQLEGYHAIGVIGYDPDLDAYMCRNSWGTGWGMFGYFWIKPEELMEGFWYIETTDEPVEEDSAKPGCNTAKKVWRIPLIGKRLVQWYRSLRFQVKQLAT